MAARIKVPADKVRTAEQILAAPGLYIAGDSVWTTCYNCGGSGNYPSQMIPQGRCRLYCFAYRTPETFGKLATPTAKYVKREQARDRREYRAQVQWEQDAPAREARQAEYARQEAERLAEAARVAEDEAARLAVSQWVGAVGDKIEAVVTYVDYRSFDSRFGRRGMYRLRDDDGNVLIWWTTSVLNANRGERFTLKATIKEHTEYNGERQTTLLRASVFCMPGRIDGRDMTAWEKKLRHEAP